MRKLFFLIFTAALLALNSTAQTRPAGFDLSEYGVRIEPDKRLIAVLAALEAAETKTPNGETVKVINTQLAPAGETFRRRLQADSAGVSEDLRLKLGMFVSQYKKRNPGRTDAEILAPFISMAYTLSPVPDLAEPLRTENLPGDLLDVLDFSPLVREYYRAARLGEKIESYAKEYQAAGDQMRPDVVTMVRQLLDYLNTRPQTLYGEKVKVEAPAGKSKDKKLATTEIVTRERRFYVVPEMLAPKGTINFRNVGDEYYAIVPPGINPTESEVRRAFLQFVVDPLILAHAREINGFRDGIKQLLDERRKENENLSPDIYLAASRSLVAAIDAKENEYRKTQIATAEARRKIDQVSGTEEKRKISAALEEYKKQLADETALRLSEAYEAGGVLAFYFARQLNGLTESGFDIASSLRDIILSLDPSAESNRLAENMAARRRAEQMRNEARVKALALVENPVTKRLQEIEGLIKAKNYAQAENDLKMLMRESPEDQPRIYYALGRVASLSAEGIADEDERNKRLLDAKLFYENVLRTKNEKTDPALISLSYVALGRIHEFFGESEYAVKIYEAAIKIGNVPDGGYQAAVAARDRLLKEDEEEQ
jgi:hypothetical protein